jgi:hypothetical protein
MPNQQDFRSLLAPPVEFFEKHFLEIASVPNILFHRFGIWREDLF